MELTESQIFDGFGLEQPTPAQTPTQEPSATGQEASGQEQAIGEQGQEAPIQNPEGTGQGLPAQEQAQEGQGEGQDQSGGQEAGKPGGEMSLEQRRENAARRRRAETRAAINQAVEQERERNRVEQDRLLAGMGLKNPTTGEPFKSVEEYRAWKQTYDSEKLQKDMAAGKLSLEGLNQVIEQHPVVQQAHKLIQESEKREREARAEAERMQVEAELAEIRKLDPSIQGVGDLLTMPRAREFYQLVQRGNTFVDAYKLAHYDQLTQQAAAAARQQAMSNSRSKDHLKAGGQQGTGAVTVPKGDMEMFRAFNPQASEADIQAYYNKYQGGK